MVFNQVNIKIAVDKFGNVTAACPCIEIQCFDQFYLSMSCKWSDFSNIY